MDKIAKDLDKGLMQELECPVCMEYMKPPITMCENGHNICNVCRPKLSNCPSCRKPFLEVRNLALESLSRVITPCDSSNNNKPPPPKSYKCPFARISKEDCTWSGTLQDMKSHIVNKHGNGPDLHKCEGEFNVVLTDLSPSRHYRKAVLSGDELFYIIWEIKDGNFFCVVFYIGSKKKCSKFKYTFSLISDTGIKTISMGFRPRNIVENIDQVLVPGECVLLHYDTVLKFVNSNKFLTCDFEIKSLEAANAIASSIPKSKTKSENKTSNKSDTEDSQCKREFLGPETPTNMQEFFDPNYRFAQMVRLGLVPRRSRGRRPFRGCRRGPVERLTEAHFHPESEDVEFRSGRELPSKNCKLGWSMTDLTDMRNYVFDIGDVDTVSNSNHKDFETERQKETLSNTSLGKLRKNEENFKPHSTKYTTSLSAPPNIPTSHQSTWKCVLCGFYVKSQMNEENIRPSGPTWKCVLCGQWRPKFPQ
ncbi:uncharacterized protein [Periplaneta americana]|uniref:uncharacterized protein n=1 Tax=Periplaneta americana TaxID=6978 RepID=UPI0037E9A474